MARDVVSGALFFVVVTVVAFALASVLPMWWYTTTELEGQQCACATGLWMANVTWGDTITEPNLQGGVIDCTNNNHIVVENCDASPDGLEVTRFRGHVAGGFSLLAIGFALRSLWVGSALLDTRTGHLQDQMRTGYKQNLRSAAFGMLVALLCEIATIAAFVTSPLFDDLGSRLGCTFAFANLANSNTLKCRALGPSFGLAVGGCLVGTFACALFYLAYDSPSYIDSSTGRYSMFQEKVLGHRPLDRIDQARVQNTDEEQEQEQGQEQRQEQEQEQEQQALLHLRLEADLSPLRRPLLQELDEEQIRSTNTYSTAKGFVVPILLMLNVGLFVWSNCSTGATVEPAVKIMFPWELKWIAHKYFPDQVDENGVVQFKDDVFNFTLFTSLKHFWSGKAYALAFLIGVFSGVWPYVKLFTLVFLWFVPSSEKFRGKLLHWLEVLGKWSLVDAYVLCLMSVAFGFNTETVIAGVGVHVDIAVRPGWGVYSFVLGTMLSLVMSHFFSHWHRLAMDRRNLSFKVVEGMKHSPHETLASRGFSPFLHRRRIACSKLGQVVMVLVLGGSLFLMLFGQVLSTFEFRFSGLADLILPEDERDTAYSLVTNGMLLPEACSKGGFLSGGPFWAWFMTIMYFLFAMVVPLTTVVALTVMWIVPMTLLQAKQVLHVCQILQSWAALDVFLISVMAAVLEIGGLSQAIIGSAFGSIEASLCDTLRNKIRESVLEEILKTLGLPSIHDELENCALFRVDAVLMDGCWLLACSVCTWGICTHIIMEFAAASIDERTHVNKVLVQGEGGQGQGEGSIDPYERLRIAPESSCVSSDTNVTPPMVPQRPQVLTWGEEQLDTGANLQPSSQGLGETAEHVFLERVLHAQEDGARRFVGTYFGDCMYGPFPREWWHLLRHAGLLRKVD